MGWGMLLALFISLVVAAVLFHLFRKLMVLFVHGVMGIAVFWLLSVLGILQVPIDWVTFLVAAFGGIIGVIIVIVFAAIGIPL